MTDDPFADFNAGVKRARNEYAAHPSGRWLYVVGCPCLQCTHGGFEAYLRLRDRKNADERRYRARKRKPA